jgi:Luciferase-like monooxygenase
MDFGIHVGTRGCLTTREAIMAMATNAEVSGYAIIGVADHLIVPVHTDVRYPYTADGVWPGAPLGECFDGIATLAFLAGVTERIRLLTSVLVVPHRPAVLTAKLLTTADVLSGGRVIAGIGSGWMKEEFAALGTPPFEERGAVTDEYLRAWKALWTEEHPAIDGRHVRFDNVIFKPKPLNTPALLKAGIDRLHRAAEKAGRDPGSIDIAYVWFMPPRWTARTGADGQRQMFTGSADNMLADAAAFRDVGARHLIVYLQQPTIEATLDVQQRFAEDVVRKFA